MELYRLTTFSRSLRSQQLNMGSVKTALPAPPALQAEKGIRSKTKSQINSVKNSTAASSPAAQADVKAPPTENPDDKNSRAVGASTAVVIPPASPQTVQINAGRSDGLAATIKRVLSPDSAGNIHEEELQYAVVVHLLEQSKAGTGNEFEKIFGQIIGTGTPPTGTEDATKLALSKLVSSGAIDLKNAESINGASFDAAQLDQFTNFLFDGSGGRGDATIALMAIDQAAAKAEAALRRMELPDSNAMARSLTAPANGILSAEQLGRTAAQSSGTALKGPAAFNPSGFLWKPVSASDGKLVVLLPKSLTGNVSSCAVYKDLPPAEETLIEKGRFSGDKNNGNRSHFRFVHPGSYYPEKCYVIAETKKGELVAFEIASSSLRNSV